MISIQKLMQAVRFCIESEEDYVEIIYSRRNRRFTCTFLTGCSEPRGLKGFHFRSTGVVHVNTLVCSSAVVSMMRFVNRCNEDESFYLQIWMLIW